MATSRRNGPRIIGALLLALGVAMVVMGLGSSTSASGRIVGGLAVLLLGAALFATKSLSSTDAVAQPSPASVPEFTVALRGYDCAQVDDLVRRVDEASRSSSPAQ